MRTVHVLRPIEQHPEKPVEDEHVFEMDDDHSHHSTRDDQEELFYIQKFLDRLFDLPEQLWQVRASIAATHGTIEDIAVQLAAHGFSVEVHTSSGGGVRSLRHTFLTAQGSAHPSEALHLIIDPSFKDQFALAHATPRYALIQSALPPLLIATPRSTLQAILILADEMAKAFSMQNIPLPPWRQVSSLLSMYNSALPQGSPSSASCKFHPRPTIITATTNAAAQQAKQAYKAQQAQHRILSKLAQWGLDPAEGLQGLCNLAAVAGQGLQLNSVSSDSPPSVVTQDMSTRGPCTCGVAAMPAGGVEIAAGTLPPTPMMCSSRAVPPAAVHVGFEVASPEGQLHGSPLGASPEECFLCGGQKGVQRSLLMEEIANLSVWRLPPPSEAPETLHHAGGRTMVEVSDGGRPSGWVQNDEENQEWQLGSSAPAA